MPASSASLRTHERPGKSDFILGSAPTEVQCNGDFLRSGLLRPDRPASITIDR